MDLLHQLPPPKDHHQIRHNRYDHLFILRKRRLARHPVRELIARFEGLGGEGIEEGVDGAGFAFGGEGVEHFEVGDGDVDGLWVDGRAGKEREETGGAKMVGFDWVEVVLWERT